MKRKIKKALWRAGIDIRKAKKSQPLDFTENDIDPISAWYQANGKNFFVRIPLGDCRYIGLIGFKCDSESQSPYIRTLVDYDRGFCTTYSGSWLESIHQNFQPQSAAEMMDIVNPSCAELKSMPASGSIDFWSSESPQEKTIKRSIEIVRENKQHGSNLGAEHGDRFFGPVSKKKGELEYKRLINAYNSIKQYGYVKDNFGIDNIRGLLLKAYNTKNPIFSCMSGQHRIAALTALGYHHVDVQIDTGARGGVIRREEVDYWPTVRNGYLTRKEALVLFDRFYDGEAPVSFKRAMQLDTINQSITT